MLDPVKNSESGHRLRRKLRELSKTADSHLRSLTASLNGRPQSSIYEAPS
jgi:hypothetical protein